MSTENHVLLQAARRASDAEFRILYWFAEWQGRTLVESSVREIHLLTGIDPSIIRVFVDRLIRQCCDPVVGGRWITQGDHDDPKNTFTLALDWHLVGEMLS